MAEFSCYFAPILNDSGVGPPTFFLQTEGAHLDGSSNAQTAAPGLRRHCEPQAHTPHPTVHLKGISKPRDSITLEVESSDTIDNVKANI